MFPLHQSNELCFQISPNPDQKKPTISSQDHHLIAHDSASLEDLNVSDQIETRRNLFSSSLTNNNINNNNNNNNNNKDNKKKMKHRDIERQRRQDMASLHASLRSLLPLQLIKGKRSISDHIHEAARYIKHLQIKIKGLEVKRDELKIEFSGFSNGTTTTAAEPNDRPGRESSDISTLAPGRLTIQPYCSGVEIGIATAGECKEGNIGILPLSRVLGVLLGEGLSIVSCVSTKVNGRFLYTIHSEASTSRQCIDMSVLEQKLNQVIFHRRDI